MEAYQVILGALDSELSTLPGLKSRCEVIREEVYGEEDIPEPNETEKELCEILEPWYKKEGDNLSLSEEENKVLAQINMEHGSKRVVVDCDPSECDDPSEDDIFDFYPYHGRVYVVYNEYADGEFYTYPVEFQEKALEIIKKKLEEEF